MQKSLEPCKTKPVNYHAIFRDHICRTLNRPSEWQKVEPTFIEMDKIRNEFDWKYLTQSEHFNSPLMRTIQDKIEEYLRYCIFMSKRFVFGGSRPDTVKGFKADWLMPWSKTSIQSSSMYFEICNFLFNYMLLNINQSQMFLKNQQTADVYKQTLQKLQSALWASSELVRYNQQLQNSMKVPFEYQESTLEFLNNLICALGYICILNIMIEAGQGKVNEEDLAGLERQIASNFAAIKGLIKSNQNLSNTFGYLTPDISARYYEYSIACLIRVADSMKKKHEDAKSKGFNGIELGYLNEAMNLLKLMDKEDFPEKRNIQKKYENLSKRVQEATLMNNEVFKAAIPPRDQLTHIKPIETKLRPIEPKNVRIPPKEAPYFAGFRSEEMDNVRSSLELYVNNMRQHAEKTFFDLKEKLNDLNKTYNIQFIKTCANLGESSLTDDFKRKVNAIRELGEKNYLGLICSVAANKQEVESNLKKIDEMTLKEVEKDKQAFNIVKNGNYVAFAQAFGDQLANIENIRASIRNSRMIEEKILVTFEHCKNNLNKIADKNVDMKQLVAAPDFEDFVSKNIADIQQLKKLSDGLELILSQHLTSQMNELLAALKEIDVDNYSQKVLMNETNIEEIYKNINEKIGPMIQDFETKVTKVMGPFDKIKEVGQKLSAANPKLGQNPLSNTLVSVDFFFVS